MYIIYEIKGKKIGCTRAKQINVRQYMQSNIGKMTVLEEHSCIYKASKREIELQKQKGYKVDHKPYWWTVTKFQPKSLSEQAKQKRISNIDWKDLAAKSHKSARKSKKGWKPINCFTKGKLFKKYDSITNASLDLNIHTGTIHNVLNPKHIAKSIKGYTFYYA